jgi:hypothetical protein
MQRYLATASTCAPLVAKYFKAASLEAVSKLIDGAGFQPL